jgi:hypothetical protein
MKTSLRKGLQLASTVFGILLMGAVLEGNLIPAAEADSAQYEVTIGNTGPAITNVKCCFNSSGGTFSEATCQTPGGDYTISEATNYDISCTFTVTDPNGYQDMSDGWVNATWHRMSVPWNSPPSKDTLYVNRTCSPVAGTGNGDTITYACAISGVRYWADAGQWALMIRSSDGIAGGTPLEPQFRINNVTTLWQSPSINFGTMALGESGSSGNTGDVDVQAVTNNTGNTRINIEVSSLAPAMGCTVGNISLGNIAYDTSAKPVANACGHLTTTSQWSGSCDRINLQDCSDECATKPTDTTYWGLTIPSIGVGGQCQLQVLFTSIQA